MRLRVFFVIALLIVSGAGTAVAAEIAPGNGTQTRVADLLQDPRSFEGDIVVVGELIGDYGFRADGFMWTQLNDDSYAVAPLLAGGERTGGNVGVAVRIPEVIGRTLGPVGGYRRRGPLVRVSGVWKYHDPARGGESYIDVVGLEIIEPSRPLTESGNPLTAAIGLLLLVAAALYRSRIRHRRDSLRE